MKRREFSLSAASAVAASALTLPVANPAMAQARQFKEGKDFKRLDKPVAPDAPAGKVDVIEFFWYSCPHCNAFEPTLDAWVKAAPKDLSIRRVPVAFNASFVPQQKLFYTLEGMGKLEALHAKVFRAIHVEKAKLAKDDEILAWVTQQGVDVAKFKEVYGSFSVANQVRRASQLQDSYGVEGVPSMGVAGKYYTDGTMAGSMQTVLQVVEYLAATARKA
ncbi:thiol:disulfide interchange protein DsbA [Acidovorax sp. 99]|uniref:Thiol:disulfide interchange protein n=1 Tax=Acidovorax delafieldii TaxID=47920 RepID=A0AAJ2BVW1_ACIDE|nr:MULTISPECIES: thiol:disulfide interchange protein DsbA/DsbL [Acidovorax]ODS79306.1 MAG: disulfide bond formation protein DsbA [Acidovorax sp. SCN 65-28]OJT99360.1 MAG: disulfide bond formation protein DsbA [Acidovorax sp. 65-7]MBN9626819.1 thiol:disulfide interchange protein DsbA/DsbL [Acidovorax sp.]MDR6768994.1 thiol:disulfide interchange protein DsbA [Acidovorax delafieldii]MDR6839371.1 thiol:disulfide interchange protein DsbA [Acidovorax delafieldii]